MKKKMVADVALSDYNMQVVYLLGLGTFFVLEWWE